MTSTQFNSMIWYYLVCSPKDGGVTVIQRRMDGTVNFDQTWQKYEDGFGDFQGKSALLSIIKLMK